MTERAVSTEILNHQRLIIVLGMARSGTTVFTYVLCRHPQIALFRDGPEGWLLENQCLPSKNASRIARVAPLFPECQYVVLKRPWMERLGSWYRETMPNAHYIVMIRSRSSIKKSWTTTGGWALPANRRDPAKLDDFYDEYLEHALRMPQFVGADRCRLVRYERMVEAPGELFEELADWLSIPNSFDPSPIAEGGHWRKEWAGEFPLGNVLLQTQKRADRER